MRYIDNIYSYGKTIVITISIAGVLVLFGFYHVHGFLSSRIRIPLCSRNNSLENLFMNLSSVGNATVDEVTVVTAYFNIGSFGKGSYSNKFNSELYRRWMTTFSLIKNPVVVYLDQDEDVTFFQQIRSSLPENMTKIIKVNRTEFWAFGLESCIRKIYEQWGYPQYTPNTVVPAYSVAMHAKYEVVQRTILQNPFRTKYICWLDIGLFRDLASTEQTGTTFKKPPGDSFKIKLMPDFNYSGVAYTEVYPRNTNLNAREIVYGNHVWVCGCYFVGRVDVVFHWTKEYMNGVENMLTNNIMSTDQQVIYWIFNHENHTTYIQTYRGDGRFSYWFHLAYSSRNY